MRKKDNKKMEKKNSKKIITLSAITIAVIILAIVTYFLFFKEKNINDIEIYELTTIEIFKEADEAKAAKAVKENIVRVINTIDEKTEIIGTGFFTKDGYLITNSHVVDIMGEINIQYANNEKSKAYLYSNSIEHDIALLKVENVNARALSLGTSKDMEATNTVLAAGYIYNFAGEATVSKGILSARREVDGLTYLQTDLALDTGSSGGPLFNDKAEIVGLNTFVTENRTFALSISVETLNLITSVLLDEPTVQYLTEKRPPNPINKILVEVNYTDNKELCLYNDTEIVEKSKEEYQKEYNEIEEDKNVSSDTNEGTYYCEKGYILIGKKCIKKQYYDSERILDDCPSGYDLQDNETCIKKYKMPYKIEYICSANSKDNDKYKLTSDNKCEYEGYFQDGSKYFDSRLGSCPAGKTCYEYAADFGDFYDKPYCEQYAPYGGTFIWEGEELNEQNYKRFRIGIYNFVHTKLIDEDGITYYENISVTDSRAPYEACVEKKLTDSNSKTIYVLKKPDNIKSTACPEGTTLKAFNNEEGFAGYACLLNIKPSLFYWNVRCSNPDAVVRQETSKGEPHCMVFMKKIYEPSIERKYCEEKGYSYISNEDLCIKIETINRPSHYECLRGGKQEDELNCVVETIVSAKKH